MYFLQDASDNKQKAEKNKILYFMYMNLKFERRLLVNGPLLPEFYSIKEFKN